MSKIDELLKNEKVEWKKLWEVTIWDKKFNGIEKFKQKKINKYHYYLSNELKDLTSEEGTIKILTTNKTELYANEESVKDNISEGEIVCIPWGGNPIIQYYKGKFITGDNRIATSLDTDELDNKFLYYSLLNKIDVISSFYRGSGIKHPDMYKVLELEIPIPSIKTQEKIVKILDKFTNYVTELQAELQARTKQYEYYRNLLLSEEHLNKLSENPETLEWGHRVKLTTLGEIGEIQMCKRILKKQTSSKGDIPFYKIGTFGKIADSFISRELYNEYKKKYSYPKKGEILISASGTIGRTVIFDGEDAYFQDSNIVWVSHNEEIVINKYLYYLYQVINWNPSTGGTINRLYNYNLKNIKVILPPIEIQNKVVEILDKFQSLLADTKGLLPQEIEQRQKQYEYYREKLLTFDENSVKRERERERAYLSNSYLNSLKEVGEIVGVTVFGVELKKLEDFAKIYDGTHQTPKYVNIGVPFVSVQDIKNIYGTNKYITIEEYNKFKVKPRKNDVFMTRIGDIGTCAIVKNDDDLAYYVTLALIRPSNDIVLSKFLKYLIESNQGKKELSKRILHNATPIKINLGEIGKLKFFIPSIPVQEHIVSILDKFDNIVNNISKGLPKEIELRQKQYEYYREKLLSFER
mgnify:CR=1 FL=1